jgi:hypothetical protein
MKTPYSVSYKIEYQLEVLAESEKEAEEYVKTIPPKEWYGPYYSLDIQKITLH